MPSSEAALLRGGGSPVVPQSIRAHRRPTVIALVAAFLVTLLPGAAAQPARAASGDLFFSEYVEGSSNNKALEIFNGTGTAVSLAGYTIEIYSNGSAAAGTTVPLSGTVADGDVVVLAQASAAAAILAQTDITSSSGLFNGNDAVVLRRGATILDVIGQIGVDPGAQWGTGVASTADNTIRRKVGVVTGHANGSDAFDPAAEWDGFANDTFDGLGAHVAVPPEDLPVTVDCGTALSAVETTGDVTRTITATDADDTVLDIALTSVTPANPQITLGSTTAADADGGTASATLTIGTDTPGTYRLSLTASNDDATPQTGACSLTVTILDVLHIGEVQGAVGDTDNGLTHRSPFAPVSGPTQTVAVRGVIAQLTLARTAAGASNYGFFLQETATATDGDPTTSDGIFVFMNTFTTLIGGYAPQVGDEVVISGRVSEFFNLTQLSSASLVRLIREDVEVAAEVPPFEVEPSADLATANRYWERREGMQAQVPESSLVQGGRSVFPGTADAEIYLIRGDYEPLTGRADPYARRVFRDPHPLDDLPDPAFDNGNGFRFLLGSLGVKATTGADTTLLDPARTFDELRNSPVGGVYFGFSKYQIQVSSQPTFEHGVDPSLNAPPAGVDLDRAYSTATYNVENLYDRRDDPFDGCDFTGNTGCPGVRPPFDYVPTSQATYDQHLDDIARQIVDDLHAPDLLLVQEAEDQDICSVSAGALACGATNDADGKPDTLQELGLRVAALGGPMYDAAFDRSGADDRGIVSGFLYRTDRVRLLPVHPTDPVLTADPGVDYRGAALPYNDDVQNPKALNADLPSDVPSGSTLDGSDVFTRAPQVGHFRVWRSGVGTSVFVDVWAISNHFSSTPDGRVFQRREQAAYAAAIVDAIEAADPAARVVVGGDFNVFPRPDDPFEPGQPIGSSTQVGPSDQLRALYEQGLLSLYDEVLGDVPASAYSYMFQGQAQTLDQQFVSPALHGEFEEARVAHVNSDWAADYPDDTARGASDHDPSHARYTLEVTVERIEALVRYLVDAGEIRGNNTARILLDRLARIRELRDEAKTDAYRSQLQAFIDQVGDFVPQWLDADVAAGLQEEAGVLLD
jgi:predicted extracellular nuclease